MKTKITSLAIALATLSSVALAQQTPTLSAASKPVERLRIHISTPLNQPAVKEQTPIYRVGNVSSRPWTKIVGWHNGTPTSWNAEAHEAQFCLLSFGAEPMVGR